MLYKCTIITNLYNNNTLTSAIIIITIEFGKRLSFYHQIKFNRERQNRHINKGIF